MDNVSHSLVSVALGELACRIPAFKREAIEAPRFRSAVLLTSFFANNLPDIDSVPSWIFHPGGLSFLVSHRGLTHSFFFAPLGAMMAAGAGLFFYRSSARRGWGWKLVLVGLAGLCAHVFMDYWNDYGVHPFSPWMNRWFYGDAVSVIEPLLWFALLPFAFETFRGNPLRYVILGLEGGMVGLAWSVPFTRGGWR